MSHYQDMDVDELAKILVHAARRACLRLTDKWQLHKFGSYKSSDLDAQFLYWQYKNKNGQSLLCEKQKGTINSYRLTPLGLEVKERLLFLGEE